MAASDAGSAASGMSEAENCSDIRLLLSAFVDNEVTPEEAVRAKNHILVCPNCASHLAFLRLTGRALGQVPEILPSPSLSARIAAATYEKPTLGERIAAWLRPAPVRVALGTAMAAGLGLVFIVPRLGEETAVNTPLPTAENTAPASAKNKAVVKKTQPGTAKVSAPASQKNPAVAAKPQSKPGTAAAPVAPSVKPPAAVAQTLVQVQSASVVRKPAPVMVASATRRENLAMMGRGAESAAAIISHVRTEPRIDRGAMRTRLPAGLGLKKPGAANITIQRNGYDRAAETELQRRAVPLPAASIATPSLSPLPTESASAPAPETSTERIASRPPVASTAVSAAAAAATTSTTVMTAQTGGKLQIRLNNRRTKDAEMILAAGADSRAGVLSAKDQYNFAAGNNYKMGITSAPVK